jgi:hypothetical protein
MYVLNVANLLPAILSCIFFLDSLCTPALELNLDAEFRDIFYSLFFFCSSEMLAVGHSAPCCGYI